jgi:hypothetical protein
MQLRAAILTLDLDQRKALVDRTLTRMAPMIVCKTKSENQWT